MFFTVKCPPCLTSKWLHLLSVNLTPLLGHSLLEIMGLHININRFKSMPLLSVKFLQLVRIDLAFRSLKLLSSNSSVSTTWENFQTQDKLLTLALIMVGRGSRIPCIFLSAGTTKRLQVTTADTGLPVGQRMVVKERKKEWWWNPLDLLCKSNILFL